MPIRILLVDDHTILRQGIRRILESDPVLMVVAEAGSGLQAVKMAELHVPDIAIVDIGMKDLNGIEATAQIGRSSPRTRVLILSMYDDERYVTRAAKAGAMGYLLKDSVEDDLLRAIKVIHSGQSFFSPQIARVVLNGYANELRSKQVEDRYDLLTQRERQVYQMLAEGRSNKDIAEVLGLSLHTVETHRIHIMEKMDVHSSAELVLSAVRRGIIR